LILGKNMRPPQGILVRSAGVDDATAIAVVHIDTWRTAYRGIVPDEILNRLEVGRRSARWREFLSDSKGKTAAWVAETTSGEVVGFVSCGPTTDEKIGFDAEIYCLYILEEFQKRGIGKTLFLTAAKWLCDRDFRSMMLWAFEDNPAVNFYKALGGNLIQPKMVQIESVWIVGVCYGWNSLEQLLLDFR
jgi:ribosomal protein S18 acetylase RimI-like enzyme